MSTPSLLSIGQLAARAGLNTSALRFYEDHGLIRSLRNSGGQRRYPRETLRRVAFIQAAQAVGLTLADIRAALATLPEQRTPTREDWQRLSASWRGRLDERIAQLMRLRDTLGNCIGCGCLSLQSCALYNGNDRIKEKGPGARYLLGDPVPEPDSPAQ